jgi:hypothetical protein
MRLPDDPLEREAWLEDNPTHMALLQHSKLAEIRCQIHDLRGKAAGLTELASQLAGVAHRLEGGDPADAFAYLSGVTIAAADECARLLGEAEKLGMQAKHLIGAA